MDQKRLNKSVPCLAFFADGESAIPGTNGHGFDATQSSLMTQAVCTRPGPISEVAPSPKLSAVVYFGGLRVVLENFRDHRAHGTATGSGAGGGCRRFSRLFLLTETVRGVS
jgi:hypothetical protein